MDVPDHYPIFSEQAATFVVAAFARAPVTNPDGKPGITLHIDTPNAVMDPKTGAPWGALGEGSVITEDKELGRVTIIDAATGEADYNWTEFENIKKKNFNAALRGDVFHYAVFAHVLGGAEPRISGVAKFKGQDLIVSLGHPTWVLDNPRKQGGTFLHELGHNLGLDHSGETNVPNREPNYLSVMNYSYQTRGIIAPGDSGGRLDFSRFSTSDIPALDETKLNETKGLNASTEVSGYGFYYYCGKIEHSTLQANEAIDWNCNDISLEQDISVSVNKNAALEMLTTHNDWNNLYFAFNGLSSAQGASNDGTETDTGWAPVPLELTSDEAAKMISIYSVGINQIPFLRLFPGDAIEHTFVVENNGLNLDTYDMTATSSLNWANLAHVPAVIELMPGEKRSFPIRIEIPATAYVGMMDELQVVAQSRASPSNMGVSQTHIHVANGDSPLLSCGSKLVTIRGTNKDDVLHGTPGDDVIHGLNGNDTIQGLGGNDIICGGNGKDDLDGGAGNDALYGQCH